MEQQGIVRNEEDILLTFLQKTAEGKYATIEKVSLSYSRMQAQTEVIPVFEEDYYYSFG